MGGKRRGAGKHVLYLAAGLALLALGACASFLPPGGADGGCQHSGAVQRLADSGDFDGALLAAQEALDRSAQGPAAAAALYDLALWNAHPGNPKRDYRRTQFYLDRLIKEHPKSPLAGEARVWAGVLESIEKSKQIDREIEGMKKGISK